MSQQYVVPQFIDVEDKILGPITVRQFVILIGTGLTLFIAYKIFSFWFFLIIGLMIGGFGSIFAFVRVNGQPFHLFFLNVVQTLRKPALRVWYKDITAAEIRRLLAAPPPPPAKPEPVKELVTTSRLQELSLIANTGGVYRPEDWK